MWYACVTVRSDVVGKRSGAKYSLNVTELMRHVRVRKGPVDARTSAQAAHGVDDSQLDRKGDWVTSVSYNAYLEGTILCFVTVK